MRRAFAIGVLVLAPACVGATGTTGEGRVVFSAAAAGPSDAIAGQPLTFQSATGFRVVLTRATVHVGAIYLNQSLPVSGAEATSCVLPGTYVAEETYGRDVDVLSPSPQTFPGLGEGTTQAARVGEVWLTHFDVNAADDTKPVLEVEGTADKGGSTWHFTGALTIGPKRLPPADPSQPSAHPICKERIVSPILTDVAARATGTLLLRIDPRPMFTNVDFSALASNGAGGFAFADADTDSASVALYQGLRTGSSVYSFSWVDAD